jgi:hypothetical protein
MFPLIDYVNRIIEKNQILYNGRLRFIIASTVYGFCSGEAGDPMVKLEGNIEVVTQLKILESFRTAIERYKLRKNDEKGGSEGMTLQDILDIVKEEEMRYQQIIKDVHIKKWKKKKKKGGGEEKRKVMVISGGIKKVEDYSDDSSESDDPADSYTYPLEGFFYFFLFFIYVLIKKLFYYCCCCCYFL